MPFYFKARGVKENAEELRAKINRVLRGSHPQIKNKQGRSTGYKGIKGSKDRLVLTADSYGSYG